MLNVSYSKSTPSETIDTGRSMNLDSTTRGFIRDSMHNPIKCDQSSQGLTTSFQECGAISGGRLSPNSIAQARPRDTAR